MGNLKLKNKYTKILIILIQYTCIDTIKNRKPFEFKKNIDALKLNKNNKSSDSVNYDKQYLLNKRNAYFEGGNIEDDIQLMNSNERSSNGYNQTEKTLNSYDRISTSTALSSSRSYQNVYNSIDKPYKSKKRVRRFLAFPEGASFTCAICATIGIVGNIDPSYGSFGLNWGLAYDLPNATWILNKLYGFKKKHQHKTPIYNDNNNRYKDHYYHTHDDYHYDRAITAISKRETRWNFFKEIEFFIKQTMGYNGKECILRALCESSQFFAKRPKKTMLEEIVRTILSLPKTRLFSFESSDFYDYDEAYRYGHKINDCSSVYNDCQFSLLDLAFGKYSQPPPNIPQPKFSSTYDPFNNPLKFN